MRRTRILPLLAASFVLAATVAVTACGDDGGGGGGQETLNLTIGDIVPLTGDLSPYGPPGRKAANMAVTEIEKAIEEAGVDHTVKIQHEDEQTEPQAAVSAARKLADAGATCIAGAWASTDSIPVARSVTIREKILQISPASTSFELTGINDDGYLNRVPPTDNLQGPTLADVIADQLGGAEGKTINVGARNDSYGTGFVDFFGPAWEKLGGTIGERVVYDTELPSYNSEAEKLASGNPDGFVIIDFPETFGKVGPALVRTGNWAANKTFITDGLVTGALPEDVGTEPTEGLRGTAPGTPEEGAPSQAFDRLYAASPPKNVERNTFDGQNFDAVMLCYLSAVAAGSTEGEAMKDELQAVSGPPGDKFTWEQLPEAIEALQNGDDIDYEGAAGPINIDDKGDAQAGVYDVIEFKNGEIEVLEQIPAGDAAEGGG